MQPTLSLPRAATKSIRPALGHRGPDAVPMTTRPHLTQVAIDQPNSRNFIGLLTAFRDSGGTAPGDIVRRLVAEYQGVPSNGLEVRIKERELFGFEWRGCIWFPMFQFELSDWSLKPGVGEVCRALPNGASNWATAIWFATSNAMLRDQMPANLLGTNLPDVLDAATHSGRSQQQVCIAA